MGILIKRTACDVFAVAYGRRSETETYVTKFKINLEPYCHLLDFTLKV